MEKSSSSQILKIFIQKISKVTVADGSKNLTKITGIIS